jgi:hypothetical protein
LASREGQDFAGNELSELVDAEADAGILLAAGEPAGRLFPADGEDYHLLRDCPLVAGRGRFESLGLRRWLAAIAHDVARRLAVVGAQRLSLRPATVLILAGVDRQLRRELQLQEGDAVAAIAAHNARRDAQPRSQVFDSFHDHGQVQECGAEWERSMVPQDGLDGAKRLVVHALRPSRFPPVSGAWVPPLDGRAPSRYSRPDERS